MTSGGAGQESGFGPQGVGLRPARSPRPVWRWLVVLAVVVSAGVVFAVWDATGHAARRPDRYPQGACVVVKAQEPGGELHAQAVRCDVDPSFTVAKVAGRSDNCGADKYTRIRPPFSDVATDACAWCRILLSVTVTASGRRWACGTWSAAQVPGRQLSR
jgi:hypothetical protein